MTSDIHSLVGAYVLDAVDDIERASFDRHLRECADCQIEVEEFREAAGRLADPAWSVPPPSLRESVMAEIARTPQLPAVPASTLSSAPLSSAPPPSDTLSGSPSVVPMRRRAPRRLLLAAAAAVVVGAGVAGTAVWVVQEQRVRDQRVVAEAARQSAARVSDILASPDVVLRDQPLRDGGRVTVASSPRLNAGVIVVAADSAPVTGTFQLWTIRPGGDPVSAGVLTPGQTAALQTVEGLPGASDVAITIEPAGGSATPTLPLIADVKL